MPRLRQRGPETAASRIICHSPKRLPESWPIVRHLVIPAMLFGKICRAGSKTHCGQTTEPSNARWFGGVKQFVILLVITFRTHRPCPSVSYRHSYRRSGASCVSQSTQRILPLRLSASRPYGQNCLQRCQTSFSPLACSSHRRAPSLGSDQNREIRSIQIIFSG